jgi:hypothetical protein
MAKLGDGQLDAAHPDVPRPRSPLRHPLGVVGAAPLASADISA